MSSRLLMRSGLIGAVVLAVIAVPFVGFGAQAEPYTPEPHAPVNHGPPPGMTQEEIDVQNRAAGIVAEIPAEVADCVSPIINWETKTLELRTTTPDDHALARLTRESMPDGFHVVTVVAKVSPKDVETFAQLMKDVRFPAGGRFGGVSANDDYTAIDLVVIGMSEEDTRTRAAWESLAARYTRSLGTTIGVEYRRDFPSFSGQGGGSLPS